MGFWQLFTIITGIIGLVAFLMAIPALFHIWGKPKIRIAFDFAHGYRLTCWIRNMPINRALSYLNIVRTQIEVSPTITITDKNKEVLHFTPYSPTISDDIRLIIAEVIRPQDGKVYLKDNGGNSTVETLAVGSYELTLKLRGDSREMKKKKIQIRINPHKPFIELIKR